MQNLALDAENGGTQDIENSAGSLASGLYKNWGIKLEFHHSVCDLEMEWLELEQRANSTPFQRYSWTRVLYTRCEENAKTKHFQRVEPFIVAGRVHGRLVFILPFVLDSSPLGKHLKWIDASVSDYNGVILDRSFSSQIGLGFFDEVLAGIRGYVPDLDSIFLTRNSNSYDAMAWMGANVGEQWPAEYGSHTLNLSRSWSSVFERTRSKKSRSRLRSKLRSLSSRGKVSFKQIRNQDQRNKCAEQILNWKTAQLKIKGSRNPFGSETSPSLTREAIVSSVNDESSSSIRVFGLFCDDEMIAGMLGFVANQNFFYLVSAYSPDVPGKFSIGTQLLIKTLELASRSGLKQYDFLLGDEAYKYDWCDRNVPMKTHFIPLSWKGRLYGTFQKSRQNIKAQVKASAFLSGLIKQILRTDFAATPKQIVANTELPVSPFRGPESFTRNEQREVFSNNIKLSEGF